MSILDFGNNIITIIDESKSMSGGRSGIKIGESGYTQLEIEAQPEHEEVLISISDNITDIDGHWSPIVLTSEQFIEFKGMINNIKT